MQSKPQKGKKISNKPIKEKIKKKKQESCTTWSSKTIAAQQNCQPSLQEY